MTKICTKCKEEKELSLFSKTKKNKSGYKAFCLKCAAKLIRDHRQKNLEKMRQNEAKYRLNNISIVRERDRKRGAIRRKTVGYYKLWHSNYLKPYLEWLIEQKNKPCTDCGTLFHFSAMDFDHVKDKKRNVALMRGMKRERVLEEINKCELVCACCHRVRTYSRKKRNTTKIKRLEYHSKIDVLKNNPCIDCGKIFAAVAMDFDHILGEKTTDISHMRDHSWEKVLLELEKCELVCACCHRVRTWERASMGTP